MDDLDHKILQLLAENARMPVKDIAQRVSLTSPAVSSRIHRLEQEGVIGGYTVVLRHPDAPARVEALISVLVDAATRASFLTMIEQEPQVLQCFRVTGSYNFIIKVSCTDIDALEHLLTKMQKMGSTNTQIILTPSWTAVWHSTNKRGFYGTFLQKLRSADCPIRRAVPQVRRTAAAYPDGRGSVGVHASVPGGHR